MSFEKVFSKEEIYTIGKYVVQNAGWRRVDNEKGKYALLVIKLPYESDLSSVGTRVDALVKASQFEPLVIKKTVDIPKEFRCSYCKKDLRDDAKTPCECGENNSVNANKSGGQFMRTTIEYKGNT